MWNVWIHNREKQFVKIRFRCNGKIYFWYHNIRLSSSKHYHISGRHYNQHGRISNSLGFSRYKAYLSMFNIGSKLYFVWQKVRRMLIKSANKIKVLLDHAKDQIIVYHLTVLFHTKIKLYQKAALVNTEISGIHVVQHFRNRVEFHGISAISC